MRPDTQPALFQVVPPGPGGVFDYLQCLKAEWEAQGQASHVIALSKELARQRSLADRVGDALPKPGRQNGRPCSVVLHFSGYGYGERGVCFWLLDELQALQARYRSAVRLVVVFHELFASGPPWRSAFWVSALQERIAVRLAAMADAIWTNTEQHASWLKTKTRPGIPLQVRPVFSNVGEPATVPPASERAAGAVVFGLASTRQRVFDALSGREAQLRRLGVQELIEIGNGPASSGNSTTLPRRHLGRLEQRELSQLLQASRFGLLDYPSRYLGKSGVFAAYVAHGCVVLDVSSPGPDTDGLVGGINYLCLPAMAEPVDADFSAVAQNAIATQGRHWYSTHGLGRQATELLDMAIHSWQIKELPHEA